MAGGFCAFRDLDLATICKTTQYFQLHRPSGRSTDEESHQFLNSGDQVLDEKVLNMFEQLWSGLVGNGRWLAFCTVAFFTAKGLLWVAIPVIAVRMRRNRSRSASANLFTPLRKSARRL